MGNHTLLLVDDEKSILSSLHRLFIDEDYRVHTASNAHTALQILRKSPVDLIISDHAMPGTSGLDFFKKTLPRYPDVVRILLTGKADLDMAINAINEGCVYKFILKPWNNEELKVTVKRALEQYDLLRANRSLSEELKKRDSILNELEQEHPGITDGPPDGVYHIS